jgi:aminoglycoside phosphotransferase (APT) family kinase protein
VVVEIDKALWAAPLGRGGPPTKLPAVRSTHESPNVVADTGDAQGLARPPLLVLRPLEAFLDAHGLGGGPVEAEPIGDGHSNITYLLRRGAERWVLRRPPRPPLPPSAHDVLREYRVLKACAGTPVRVAEPLAACDDLAVIGAPFYVMGYVPGVVMTTALPEGYDPVLDAERVVDELVSALAEIHALDWRSAGLADYAPSPETYIERQLSRFGRLWKHNKTREIEAVERVSRWLDRARPSSSSPTLVHGDFRLGNSIFSAEAPARLLAVLDWELSTIGDPLADLGYLTATYAVAGDHRDPLVRLGPVTALPGFPDRDGVIERYASASGRDVGDLLWYEALALWKGAIFLEGSYGRMLNGTTDDPFFAELERGVPELAARAWELAQRAGATR